MYQKLLCARNMRLKLIMHEDPTTKHKQTYSAIFHLKCTYFMTNVQKIFSILITWKKRRHEIQNESKSTVSPDPTRDQANRTQTWKVHSRLAATNQVPPHHLLILPGCQNGTKEYPKLGNVKSFFWCGSSDKVARALRSEGGTLPWFSALRLPPTRRGHSIQHD